MDIVVLIPAYRPDGKMLTLLAALQKQALYKQILVVDDGSGEDYAPVFAAAMEIPSVHVLRHGVNAGKGRALKTGLHSILSQSSETGVVTADCDGQHTPEDIKKVALTLQAAPSRFIVGGRAFTGNVPFKSRAGNAIMRFAFRLSTGVSVHDTQTGLRGIPPADIGREAVIPGERYEYEMNVLLSLPGAGIAIEEVPIQTIYLNNNAGSHFHAVRDAMRVFGRMLAFISASLISLAVDYGIYILLDFFPLSAQTDYAIARLLSSVVNFSLNRSLVFRSKGSLFAQLISYYALAAVLLFLGIWSVRWLSQCGMNRYVAKLLTDAVLFAFSFFIQRSFIFRSKAAKVHVS